MSMKGMIKRVVEGSNFLLRLWMHYWNNLECRNNVVVLRNINNIGNNILLNGEGSISFSARSYMRKCKVDVSGENNKIVVNEDSCFYNSKIRCFGHNNEIIIGKGCEVYNCDFFISGDENRIIIEDMYKAHNAEFQLVQNANRIWVKRGTTMHGRDCCAIHMVADEGKSIIIGEDCMLSKSIQIRTSDSHSVTDLKGKRLNPSADVVIGDHCWISLGCIILKGTDIASHSVVAAGAICTKKYEEEHCVLAGNPAKIVKRQIDWDRKFVK